MRYLQILQCIVTVLLLGAFGHVESQAGDSPQFLQTRGPLRQSPDNPRYFADADNRVVYVTGSHTWENFQDVTQVFDYPAYLDRLTALQHNFIRLWVTESIHSDGGWLMNPPPMKRISHRCRICGPVRASLWTAGHDWICHASIRRTSTDFEQG
ncbi:MAG: hypothetical protein ABS70_00885 [Nitrospira sp. SCN 59-13]|nr:MAG: hypothetical protein ABS70_00885 [Nitrospira sp. SCN 59-13]